MGKEDDRRPPGLIPPPGTLCTGKRWREAEVQRCGSPAVIAQHLYLGGPQYACAGCHVTTILSTGLEGRDDQLPARCVEQYGIIDEAMAGHLAAVLTFILKAYGDPPPSES